MAGEMTAASSDANSPRQVCCGDIADKVMQWMVAAAASDQMAAAVSSRAEWAAEVQESAARSSPVAAAASEQMAAAVSLRLVLAADVKASAARVSLTATAAS